MLTTYIIGSLALIVKPGPDLTCTIATALSDGKARAATLMLGLVAGCWIWILLDAIRSFRAASPDALRPASGRGFRLFLRGIAMSMSNPLTILFFLAFLPSFTRPDSTLAPAVQTLLLGTLFCALVPFVYLPAIVAADFFRAKLVGSVKATATLKLVSALMLAAVVVVLACNIF